MYSCTQYIRNRHLTTYNATLYSIQDGKSEELPETDRCMKLDKAVKLSALKLQVQLTYQDIFDVYKSHPISNNNSSPGNSTDVTLNKSTATNATDAVSTNITVLQSEAAREITSVFQEIVELEKYYVR